MPPPPPSRPQTLNFITSNANKLREVIDILGGGGGGEDGVAIEIHSAAVEVPEIQGTVEEIARDKAARAAEAVGGPVLTEDTALEFGALGGLPGPFMYVRVFHTLCKGGLSSLSGSWDVGTGEFCLCYTTIFWRLRFYIYSY